MTPLEQLANLMRANGLSQSDLIERVGYKMNLLAFFAGQRGLSYRAAVRLGKYFNVSPTMFLAKDQE